MAEPPVITLAQTLLHTLDAFFKKPFIGIVADPVNVYVFSLDSLHQLTIVGVSALPLLGCSSRDHRQNDHIYCLGISPPSSSRQPGWPNSFCCLQYGWRKGSIHIINTTAAWGKRPEVDTDHSHYFLAQMGVICQLSSVDRQRSLCLPHRSVSTEATKRCHMWCDIVVIRDG